MPKVPVNVLDSPYHVFVEPGLLARVGQELRSLTLSPKVAVVTETTVEPLHLPALQASLRAAGFEVIAVTIPAGEAHKNIATVSKVYDALLPAKLDRATPVIALGGGVIGDMAGFAAATILRGVPLVQVPTTLLSMVDASVGGKTGVNHAVGKNLIGAFHQPIAVFIDPMVLKTLPPRELRGGLAECIKHDIIRDADGFAKLEKSIGLALELDVAYLTDLVAHNVAIKAKVVSSDPFEKGERAHLNFGHTFGHAIETVSKYEYSHGECVALGMVAASHAAVKLRMLADADRGRIVEVIRRAGLPVSGLRLDVNEIVGAMAYDKKVESGKVRFVLPNRIGNVVIQNNLPVEVVRDAVASLKG